MSIKSIVAFALQSLSLFTRHSHIERIACVPDYLKRKVSGLCNWAQIRVQKFSPESEEKLVYVTNNSHNDHLFCYGIEKPVSCEQLQETHIKMPRIGYFNAS